MHWMKAPGLDWLSLAGSVAALVVAVLLAVIDFFALLGTLEGSYPRVLLVLAAVALVVMGLDVLIYRSGLFFGSGGIRDAAIAVPAGTALVLVAAMVKVNSRRRMSSVEQGFVNDEAVDRCPRQDSNLRHPL